MAHLTVLEISLRLLMAFLAGFVIGWEREARGRPAGLRTNILACVASAIAMIVSLELVAAVSPSNSATVRGDLTRIPAGILTGIGFLGGGTILRSGECIRGVTTAASLWFMTILGLAFGSGFYVLGGLGAALGLLTLFILRRIEKILRSDSYSELVVTATLNSLNEDGLRQRVEDLGAKVQMVKLSYDVAQRIAVFTCDVRLARQQRFELPTRLLASLTQITGVQKVEWR